MKVKPGALSEIKTQKTELGSLIDAAFAVVGKAVRKETNRGESDNVMKLASSVEHNRTPGVGRRRFVGPFARVEQRIDLRRCWFCCFLCG